jgi:amino acid adenylation domain-containing protein
MNEKISKMNIKAQHNNEIYKVVMNHEEQYSIWPADHDVPIGWRDVDMKGAKKDCLAFIKRYWDDLRPVTIKNQEKISPLSAKDSPTNDLNDECVHHVFEDKAVKTPDAPAIIFEDQQLTYSELNRRANQLAHCLRKLGIGPENKIGLCVERSIEMAVGMLGILKAGAAYVPMDPTNPDERLAVIFKDAQVSLLLTQQRLRKKIENSSSPIFLDQDWPLISKHSEDNLNIRLSGNTLSHVIYTSGSTGMPKGVMVTHASLRHNVQTIRQALNIKAKDIYLHTASIAFTSSLRQSLVPLCAGAVLVISTQEQRTNPLALFDLILRRKVTIIDTVGSFWEICIDALEGLDPNLKNRFLKNKLRLVLSSGGELYSNVPKCWRHELKHGATLVNMYGQTETIGNILIYPISFFDDSNDIIPLGQPIEHVQAYLLNEHLRPVPVGVPAELHIGGSCLARGYLNQPDLTAEKFVPNPFSSEPGARLYKTGDRARLRSDGNLEFIGRVDFQISIRGFRIEPAEIEAALREHPGIKQVAVIVQEEVPGEKQLIAYLVSDPAYTFTISELRDLLSEKLPEYMVPSSFVMLDALPRLSNGKLDRLKLTQLDKNMPDSGRPYVAPQTGLQRFLSHLWCKILKIDRVGIHDKFFELGGNSLLAARLVNSLQIELGVSIFVISVFRAPSIAEYAAFLKKHYAQAIVKRFPQEAVFMDETREKKCESGDMGIEDIKTAVLKSRRNLGKRQRQLRMALWKSWTVDR